MLNWATRSQGARWATTSCCRTSPPAGFARLLLATAPLTIAIFCLVAKTAGNDAAAADLRIAMPAVIVAEPDKLTPIAIQITPATSNIPPRSFVRIDGLHKSATLSAGYFVSAGAWAVPLKALTALSLTAPISAAGNSELTVALVTVDGAILAQQRAKLIVAPAWLVASEVAAASPSKSSGVSASSSSAPPATGKIANQAALAGVARLSPATSQPTQETAPPEPRAALSPANLDRAIKLVEQGRKYLDLSNVAVARQFFRRAADLRYAQAALLLAQTYDPSTIAALSVPGLTPDVALARKWYEKAKVLGAAEATAALTLLQGR
ncbi:MAG: hypothetical protein RLZ98_2294 [Pseudomonadota bacterium]|jgi:hypothetical protein